MFPLFEWEAQNIRRQRKQFIKQNIDRNVEMSSSKQVYVTKSCVKDPNPDVTWKWRYLYTVIFNVRTLNKVRLKIVYVFCVELWVPTSSLISFPVLILLLYCFEYWALFNKEVTSLLIYIYISKLILIVALQSWFSWNLSIKRCYKVCCVYLCVYVCMHMWVCVYLYKYIFIYVYICIKVPHLVHTHEGTDFW